MMMRRSWETNVMGAMFSELPVMCPDMRRQAPKIFQGQLDGRTFRWLINLEEWPNAMSVESDFTLDPDVHFAPGASMSVTPVPTLWVSAMLEQTYWDGFVGRYGSQALKFPRMFAARVNWYGAWFGSGSARRRHVRYPDLRDRGTQWPADSMERALDSMVRRLDYRRKTWNFLRPWFRQEYKVWRQTPYSVTPMRGLVERFRHACDVADEWEAHQVLQEISMRFVSGAPFSPPYMFLFQAIGIVAQCVLPRRGIADEKDLPPLEHINGRKYKPSKTSNLKWTLPVRTGSGGTIGVRPIDPTARTGLLHVARAFLDSQRNAYPISGTLEASLLTEISYLLERPNVHSDDWLPFRFSFPPYDPLEAAQNRYVPYSGTPAAAPESSQDTASYRGDMTAVDPYSAPLSSMVDGPAVDARELESALPAMARAHMALVATGGVTARAPTKYWTVGEVGNQWGVTDDGRMHRNWVLVDDGQHGFDVYDISGEKDAASISKGILHAYETLTGRSLFPHLDFEGADRRYLNLDNPNIARKSRWGTEIISKLVIEAVRRDAASQGKLLMWRLEEDVSATVSSDEESKSFFLCSVAMVEEAWGRGGLLLETSENEAEIVY